MAAPSTEDGTPFGERELVEALGLHTAPREVSYTTVALGVVVAGTLVTLLVAHVAKLPRRAHIVAETAAPAVELAQAEALYRRGQFAEARSAFTRLEAAPHSQALARDYLARLARVDADAVVLAKARARLSLGDPADALTLVLSVAPNSPLAAEARSLERSAHEELDTLARDREVRERPAEAVVQGLAAVTEATQLTERELRREARRRARRERRASRDAAANAP
jgi:hypothetical protein